MRAPVRPPLQWIGMALPDSTQLEAHPPAAAFADAPSQGPGPLGSAPEPPAAAPPPFVTPPDPTPLPLAGPDGRIDLSDPRCYLSRELTWLNFNYRVLHEAADSRTPLLERVKFLAIVSSNLDEFFMKRIGGLKQQLGAGITARTPDGRTPGEQIEACLAVVRDLELRKRDVFQAVRQALGVAGIHLLEWDELTAEERQALRDYYLANIYPLVTPQATDPAHPFPFISNLSLNLLVALRDKRTDPLSLARVKVPVGAGTPRFLRVPGRQAFVRMESVMAQNLDLLFPGMEIESVALFRVTRNANTEHEEERAEDLLALIETELRERKFAPVVRITLEKDIQPQHRGMLAAELGLDEQADVFEVEGMLGMKDLFEIARLPDPALHDEPHHPVDHPGLTTDRNVFHVLRTAGPFLLWHPYQSYATSVERFLEEASRDPKVRAIKMCLYRTSATSMAVDHLIEAARNGKQVAVVVELKARFDEAANIRWASRLEEAGIHVTYGVVGLKTHCKVILVVRQDFDGLRRYAHVGTGNYHADTARLYCDLGLLTCDHRIGQDLTELFNYLTTGFRPKRRYERLLPSPKHAKAAVLQKIEREVAHAQAGRKAALIFKLNALEDADVTRALYRASQAGVRVDLIVRDTCRLRPGIPGLSETVTVLSVVGRFLEHGRVYWFRNGGDEECYIGSADLMKRNLDSRVEVLAPVDVPALRREIKAYLQIQIEDRRSAWEMRPDGSYAQRQPAPGGEARSAQERWIAWAEQAHREATRLRRRKPRTPSRRPDE